jgi:hypothetical protein
MKGSHREGDVVTDSILEKEVGEMLADAMYEFAGEASAETAEWVIELQRLIFMYAIATSVTDPDRTRCLKTIRDTAEKKAQALGLCSRTATPWAAGLLAVTVANDAARFVDHTPPEHRGVLKRR